MKKRSEGVVAVRLFGVILFAFMISLPAWAQDETDEDPAATEMAPAAPSADESSPPEQSVPPSDPKPAAAPPTPALRPTPTAVPGPGTIVFADNFDDLTRAFFPRSATDANTRSQGYVDGEYEIVSGTSTGVSVSVPGIYTDSSIAIDVRVFDGPDGPQTARAGVKCRGAANVGYELRVLPAHNPTGRIGPRFQLVKLQEGPDVTLIDQGPSSAIRDKGEVNRMELTCVGSAISGSINGTQVFSVTDRAYASGRHGFGVGGDGTRGRFDSLVVTLR